jgi:hypothetical protein
MGLTQMPQHNSPAWVEPIESERVNAATSGLDMRT